MEYIIWISVWVLSLYFMAKEFNTWEKKEKELPLLVAIAFVVVAPLCLIALIVKYLSKIKIQF